MIRSGLVQYHDELGPMMADIDSITPHPDNYNNGDVDDIAISIQKTGMYRPVYVQRSTGYIFAGNHTWMACKTLGATEIPVVTCDVDDDQALGLMIRDNELARAAKPDKYALYQLLEKIKDSEGDLEGTGHTDQSLEQLKHLSEMPLEYDNFAQWPTISIQIPPHVRNAFYRMTSAATDDRERFELLLRLAGWDGGIGV